MAGDTRMQYKILTTMKLTDIEVIVFGKAEAEYSTTDRGYAENDRKGEV